MNYPSATIYHDFSNSSSPEGDPAAAPDDATPPAPSGTTAGQATRRGRPSGYAPQVIDMLCGSIRKYGLSDSAAAEQHGMSTTTISRWKKQYPEVAPRLLQARHEIRLHHLDLISRHAEAENMRGLRASMWILERLFPGDYAPRMEERFAHRNFEDQRLAREDRSVREEEHVEMQAAREAQRAEEAKLRSAGIPSADASDAPGEAEAGDETAAAKSDAPASEDDSRNSRNSSGTQSLAAEGSSASTGQTPTVDNLCSASEGDARSSRNSEGDAAQGAAVPHHTQQAATAAKRQEAAAVQGDSAPHGDALGDHAWPASESVSHYSRNSACIGAPSEHAAGARPACKP